MWVKKLSLKHFILELQYMFELVLVYKPIFKKSIHWERNCLNVPCNMYLGYFLHINQQKQKRNLLSPVFFFLLCAQIKEKNEKKKKGTHEGTLRGFVQLWDLIISVVVWVTFNERPQNRALRQFTECYNHFLFMTAVLKYHSLLFPAA